MEQLGKLAVICATRTDTLFHVYEGMVCVYVTSGIEQKYMVSAWNDVKKLDRILYELNYGEFAQQQQEKILFAPERDKAA